MSKTPIYQGIAQSDLDMAGFDLLNWSGGGGGTGHGIPAGGTAGQSLTKIDSTDYNAHWSTVTGGGTTTTVLSHQVTATELLNAIPGTRTPIASLAPNTGNWFDSQTYDPCVILNPNDSTQLIMFFSGMGAPVATGVQQIGRATASVADPTTWTVSNSGNPIITPTLAFETGGSGLRADSVLYNPTNGTIYLFYTAKDGTTGVGLATSTDLGLTWTKLGLVLTPSGGETNVSQMAVLMEGTTLHAVYAYRNGGVLPGYKYASATTANWLSWTKSGGNIYTDPSPGRYHEFHQLFKILNTYVLCYESGSTTVPYDLRFATSTNPASGWVISPVTPFLQKSGVAGTFDRYHTATGAAVVINGSYYMIYCGAIDHDQPYGTNHWQMGITPLLTSSQVSSLYIGTDLRLVSLTGGGKLQARNPSTNTWADVDQWTNP